MAQILTLVVANFETTLAQAVSSLQTTGTLSSITDRDGNTIPNGFYCLAVDLGNSSVEYFTFTLTGTAMTNIKTVTAQGVTTVGFKNSHAIGAVCKLTDFINAQKMADLLAGRAQIDGLVPLTYDVPPTYSSPNNLATKGYIDGIAVSGSPDATTTVKGISKMSVAPALASSPISVGDNDPRMPITGQKQALAGTFGTPATGNEYVTATDVATTSTANKIVRALGTGKIDPTFVSNQLGLYKFGTISSQITNSGLLNSSSIISTFNILAATLAIGSTVKLKFSIKIQSLNASGGGSYESVALAVGFGGQNIQSINFFRNSNNYATLYAEGEITINNTTLSTQTYYSSFKSYTSPFSLDFYQINYNPSTFNSNTGTSAINTALSVPITFTLSQATNTGGSSYVATLEPYLIEYYI